MSKIIRDKFPFYLIAMGLFFTPYLLRDHYMPQGLYPINFLTWFGIWKVAVWKQDVSLKVAWDRRKTAAVIMLLAFLFTFSLQGMKYTGFPLVEYVKFYIAVLFPIPIFFMDLDRNGTMKMLSAMIRILNICILAIFAGILVDVVFDQAASWFFTNFYGTESLRSCYDQGRLVSYLGHSLLSAEVGLMYFVLNYIDVLYFHTQRNRVLFVGIAFVVIAMSGSKTALVILLAATLCMNLDLKSCKYLIVIGLVMVILAYLGVFDMILARFLYWGNKGDITSGRNSALIELCQDGVMKFSWFRGNDAGLSSEELIAANEYPVVRWAFRFGIVWMIVLCLAIFTYPALQVLFRCKKIKFLILYSACLLYVNTYSTLQSTQDGMLRFAVFTCLLLNVSRYIGDPYESEAYKSC